MIVHIGRFSFGTSKLHKAGFGYLTLQGYPVKVFRLWGWWVQWTVKSEVGKREVQRGRK